MLLLEYVVVAALVVFASIKASRYIDLIDKTTKLSGAFLGGVLLSAVTTSPNSSQASRPLSSSTSRPSA